VLPGVALAVFLVGFPIHWVVMLIQHFGTSSDDSGSGTPLSLYYYFAMIPPEVLEYFGRAFFAPLIVTTVGARIAPKYKFPTAIALAIGLGVFYGWAATMIANDISSGLYTSGRWLNLVVTIFLLVAGVTVGLFQAHKYDKAKRSTASEIHG
jgi:uncharacterized membrane protein